MSVNIALITQIRALSVSNPALPRFTPAQIKAVEDATLEFFMAPDSYADVGRIPFGVKTFPQLLDHLRSITVAFKSRDNKKKLEDEDFVKDGRLRLYKSCVCGIHAIHLYYTATPLAAGPIKDIAEAVFKRAKRYSPENMSKGGAKLWDAMYGSDNPRMLNLLICLLYLITVDASTVTPGAPAQGPPAGPDVPPAGGENAGDGGSEGGSGDDGSGEEGEDEEAENADGEGESGDHEEEGDS